MDLQPRRKARLRSLLCLAASVALALLLTPPAPSASPDGPAASLSWIPADAAFYSASLRNREQIEIIGRSKAWAALRALPAVRMAEQMVRAQLQQPSNPQAGAALQLLQQPENKQLLTLLGDMFSDEVFCYGDQSIVGFLRLAKQLNNAMQYGPSLAQVEGGKPNLGRMLLRVLADNRELIRVPDVVIGFRLNKTEPAQAQLKRLEKHLQQLVEQVPSLKGRFQRARTAGGDFLTLRLDGSLLPREKLEEAVKDLEEKEGEFDDLVKTITHLKLTISLGLRENFLLLSLGASDAGLTKLGSTSRLADSPELKPLAPYTQKRLTSLSYISRALRAQIGTGPEDFNNLAKMAGRLLRAADIPAEQQQKVRKDLSEMARDLKDFWPEAGPALAFTFLTDRGYEGYTYDWTRYPNTDASRPLTLLDHAGGSPILVAAMRQKYNPQAYQFLVKWVKALDQYVRDLVVPKLDEDKRTQFEQVAKVVRPALQKLNQITADELLPALKAGQAAFVLDAKLQSKQWHRKLPAAARPLPMLEPALVFEVSDAPLLRKAFANYRSAINDLIAKLHEQLPEQVPDFKIPEPWTRQVESGTLYGYPLPAAAGLDKQIAPNAGLSDKVADLSLSAGQSERLLARHPLKIESGPLADRNRPLAGAVYFDWAALVTAASPWVDYGVRTVPAARAGDEGEGEAPPGGDNAILKQVHTVLDVLKCLRTYTSATYPENNVLITHGETVFKDL